MEIIEVEGIHGPLKQIVASVWRESNERYQVLLDNPRTGKCIVITLDVRSLVREAVLRN